MPITVAERLDRWLTKRIVKTQQKTPKPLRVADLGDGVREAAKCSESAPQRNRTFNLLIKSQLLCQLS